MILCCDLNSRTSGTMAVKWLLVVAVLLLLSVSSFSDFIRTKECTNIPSILSSHTVKAELMITMNETWKEEMFSHYHLNPTDESTWIDLRQRKILKSKHNDAKEEFDWVMLYRRMRGINNANARINGESFLSEVSLSDVRIDSDSMYGQAQQTNLEYLLLLDVDRLVWNFRNQANLPAPGQPYGGWEAPQMQLRGHFVGHYMSASAHMWASTNNNTLYEKMSSVVDALEECQNNMGTGYLSAFPTDFFDKFEAIQPIWAPYYTIHKIMAGLLDQHLFANSEKSLKMATWMADYFAERVKNVIQKYTIERHWRSLNEETGGMNDVLYRLYSITNNQKHLVLAHLFDKPCFLGLLAIEADSLSNFHTNSHIPIVVGAQMRYEVTGDPIYKEISAFFLDIVNSSHSYATGGTSVDEFWFEPKRLADTLSTETEESCTTYNMLKVSRNLFRWTKEMAYADYYERTLMNGVLSIQRGREPGVMIYMLPQGPGLSKAHSYHGWGTKYDSFWCCYGTGIESFSKLGDTIYFEDKDSTPGLYIIQYIPSSFSWKRGGLTLHQTIKPVTSSDPFLRVSLEVSADEKSSSQPSTLNLRIPSWTSIDGLEVDLNGNHLQPPYPGNFLSQTKKWTSTETLTLKMPISLRTEAIKDDRPEYGSYQAILFGPYLLAGLTTGDWDIKTGKLNSISDWMSPIPSSYNSQLISLTQELNNQAFFVTNSNGSLKMDSWPMEGTNAALYATFRIFGQDNNIKAVDILKFKKTTQKASVMLEPFDLPGMVVEHQGPGKGLVISTVNSNNLFYTVKGLDGKQNSISFESVNNPGCFLSSSTPYTAGVSVQLKCVGSSDPDQSFKFAASFIPYRGVRQYNPISFVAKGSRRNYVLEPLLSLRDEYYTIYFDIQP